MESAVFWIGFHRFVVLCELGEGGHANVMLVRHRRYVVLGKAVEYAAKVFHEGSRYAQELVAMRKFASDMVVFAGGNVIVMPLADKSLDDLIVRNVRRGWCLRNAKRYMRELCEFLANVHDKGWCHGDIKPSNILMFGDRVRLCDWSSAQECEADSYPVYGTSVYMAPEQLAERRYDWRADIWAVFACFYEMVSGVALFAECRRPEIRWNCDFYESLDLVDNENYGVLCSWHCALGGLPEDVAELFDEVLWVEDGRLTMMYDRGLEADSLANHVARNMSEVEPGFVEFLEWGLRFDKEQRPTARQVCEHRYLEGV